MSLQIFKLFFILFCVLISIVLYGCKQENKIKFYRESAIRETINAFKEPEQKKNTVTKSAGVVIYKDKSGAQDNNSQGVTFGPKEIQFDLPIKIK